MIRIMLFILAITCCSPDVEVDVDLCDAWNSIDWESCAMDYCEPLGAVGSDCVDGECVCIEEYPK